MLRIPYIRNIIQKEYSEEGLIIEKKFSDFYKQLNLIS